MDQGMNYVLEYHLEIMSEILKFKAQTTPFKDYLFSNNALNNTSSITWWLALRNNISEKMLSLNMQLHSAVASSAVLSTFGFIYSKVRNRLGIQKAGKLITIFKHLNK
ncbi:unnamed protein product [Macrosiphum euphorbiae]|uniref:Uncharacterized protein n=1 Tax=Macrosiphum euphorbiae TaxID=13131 RepID=A0AAV0XTE5_9HEMI|nr:unnamed protein product [Macrosiphum euphorbiae]